MATNVYHMIKYLVFGIEAIYTLSTYVSLLFSYSSDH